MKMQALWLVPVLGALMAGGCINVSETSVDPSYYASGDDFDIDRRRVVIEEPAPDRAGAAEAMEVLLDEIRAAGCRTISARSWRELSGTDRHGLRVVASCPKTAKLAAG